MIMIPYYRTGNANTDDFKKMTNADLDRLCHLHWQNDAGDWDDKLQKEYDSLKSKLEEQLNNEANSDWTKVAHTNKKLEQENQQLKDRVDELELELRVQKDENY